MKQIVKSLESKHSELKRNLENEKDVKRQFDIVAEMMHIEAAIKSLKKAIKFDESLEG